MPKKRSTKTKAEQEEILNKPIRTDGVGEDPVVKAILDESAVDMKDSALLEISNQLREIISGQKFQADLVAKLQERMDNFEDITRKFQEDREKFIQEVFDKATSLEATGSKRDEIQAKGAKQFEVAMQNAVAKNSVDKIKFREIIKNEPLEEITVPGVHEVVMQAGVPTPVIGPEVIRIRDMKWVIMPNKPTKVPRLVANRYRQLLRDREETRERQVAFMANLKDTELAKRIDEINKKYGSPTEAIPIGSTAI